MPRQEITLFISNNLLISENPQSHINNECIEFELGKANPNADINFNKSWEKTRNTERNTIKKLLYLPNANF